jgi:hypothetical protein
MSRVCLLGVTLFWVTMNVLLWRAEFGAARHGGAPVALSVVLEKILTAPDSSTLEVIHQGQRVGFIHWYPDPGEEPSAVQPLTSGYVPEGMVQSPRGYVLRLDGQMHVEPWETRLRWVVELKLAPDRVWRELKVQAGTRFDELDLRADAVQKVVRWRVGLGNPAQERSLRFDELEDPRRLLQELGGPLALVWLPSLAPLARPGNVIDGLRWEARNDWFRIGHSQIRAYRIQLRWSDRVEATLRVNRVGEILQLDLPGGLRLVNAQLLGL